MNRELSLETGRGRRRRSQSLTSETTSIFDCRLVVHLASDRHPKCSQDRSELSLRKSVFFLLESRFIDSLAFTHRVSSNEFLLVATVQYDITFREQLYVLLREQYFIFKAKVWKMLLLLLIRGKYNEKYHAFHILLSRMVLETSIEVVKRRSHSRRTQRAKSLLNVL